MSNQLTDTNVAQQEGGVPNVVETGDLAAAIFRSVRHIDKYEARFIAELIADFQVVPSTHTDDLAVDKFASAMKSKLAQKRMEGRGGWDNTTECTIEFLQHLMSEHIAKGDPVDVGNFAMMLFNRGAALAAIGQPSQWQPIESAPKDRKIEAWAIAQGATITVEWCESREAFVDYRGMSDKLGEANFQLTHWREMQQCPA